MEMNHENVIQLQRRKYDLYKEQNPETGQFNVTFEADGKLLHAHQDMINLVSPAFTAWLSERWTSDKKEPIKIERYGYDDFYQFITFFYSGQCQLTDTNIYSMIDIAEFFGVDLFRTYCLTYLTTIKITVKNVFPLMGLAKKFSIYPLRYSVDNFIANNFSSVIKSNELLEITKSLFSDIIVAHKYKATAENVFEGVFEWSEKQAKDKQAADPNLNLNDTIKNEISDFLPHINFYGMDRKFLHGSVVPKAFIFPSFGELGKILCDHDRLFGGRIKVTNASGQKLHGNLIPDKSILRIIESLKYSTGSLDYDHWCKWYTECKIPSTPSPFKKRDGVRWILDLDKNGNLFVAKSWTLEKTDYILAELFPGPTGFEMFSNCKIEIE